MNCLRQLIFALIIVAPVFIADPALAVDRKLSLPFAATHVVIDETGTRLFVWQVGKASQLGLVDAATGDAIATREIPTSIITATLWEDSVAVLTKSADRAWLLRLDPKSLETKAERAIEVKSSTRYLDSAVMATFGSTLSIQTSSGVGFRFALPDLKDATSDTMTETNATQPLRSLTSFICTAPPPVESAPSRPQIFPYLAQVTFAPRELQTPSESKHRYSPVYAGAFPVRLGVQLIPQAAPGLTRLELVARDVVRGDVVRAWAVEMLDPLQRTRDMTVCWCANGTTAVVLFDGFAYVKDLAALKVRQLPGPFKLGAGQNPALAAIDGKTRLKYSLTGGKPPYTVEIRLRVEDVKPGQTTWAEPVPDTDTEFDADVAGYLHDQLEKIARNLVGWSKATASADSIQSTYINSIAEQFAGITGHKPSGIPVAIPITVSARDAEGATQQFVHYVLADLPKEMLDSELNVAVANRWPGTVAASDARDRVAAARASRPSPELLQFSKQFRATNVHKEYTREELESAAQQALDQFEQGWRQAIAEARRGVAQYSHRKWVDAQGNSIQARFEFVFAGQVVVSVERGPTITLPFDKLSEADQKYIRELTDPASSAERAANEARIVLPLQLRLVGVAFHNFHNSFRVFLPPAFVNNAGQPATSWRVALLPFLGGQELFRLYRLDEPWDSEHNQVLARYMPSVFRVPGLATEPTKTTIVRLVGPRTAAPRNELISFSNIQDGMSNTLLLTIARPEHAVVWTKPDDLEVIPERPFVEQFWWNEDQTTVVMCDASVLKVSRQTSLEAWQNAATCNDGRPTNLQAAKQ